MPAPRMTTRLPSPTLCDTAEPEEQPVRLETPSMPRAAIVRYTPAAPATEPTY